jgi:hypothetical protein
VRDWKNLTWKRNCIRSRVSKMERKIRDLFSVTKDFRKTCWLTISSGILPIPAKISRVVFFPATDSCRQDQIDFRSETSDYSNSIDTLKRSLIFRSILDTLDRMQFLFHTCHTLCYFYYKPVDKTWMRKDRIVINSCARRVSRIIFNGYAQSQIADTNLLRGLNCIH